ncbi:HPr family phosphocarrier protein [Sodalis praecaptivus]|uniref:HPr family phosphocarrier protein n=1 Tax=Sodalis TaxID=84565 RepID=UPI00046D4325|nr:HPr family phosphocarrier protein [Sodalis praecaptivus]
MSDDSIPEKTLILELPINNEYGLHARPAAELVKVIKSYKSDISVANLDGTGKEVNGRSMMKIVSLGVKKGHRLRFNITGEDAQDASDGLRQSIISGLGE